MKFNEYTFLKEEIDKGGLTDNVKSYIDSKFDAIEERIADLGGGSRYNVIPAGEGLLDVIDIDKQTVAGKLSFQGELISSPIVHGNKVSFAIQKTLGEDKLEVLGVIYELPSGTNIGNFRVEQSDPDVKYQTIMGVDEIDEPAFPDPVDTETDDEDDQDKPDDTIELDDPVDQTDQVPQVSPNELDDIRTNISSDLEDIRTQMSDRDKEIVRLKAREEIAGGKRDKKPEVVKATDI